MIHHLERVIEGNPSALPSPRAEKAKQEKEEEQLQKEKEKTSSFCAVSREKTAYAKVRLSICRPKRCAVLALSLGSHLRRRALQPVVHALRQVPAVIQVPVQGGVGAASAQVSDSSLHTGELESPERHFAQHVNSRL